MPSRPKPVAKSGRAPTSAHLTDEEAFDLKCIRFRNVALATHGCGAKDCPVETCAVARHARLIVRALDALVRTHT
jgi:hypothetical protein